MQGVVKIATGFSFHAAGAGGIGCISCCDYCFVSVWVDCSSPVRAHSLTPLYARFLTHWTHSSQHAQIYRRRRCLCRRWQRSWEIWNGQRLAKLTRPIERYQCAVDILEVLPEWVSVLRQTGMDVLYGDTQPRSACRKWQQPAPDRANTEFHNRWSGRSTPLHFVGYFQCLTNACRYLHVCLGGAQTDTK